MSKKLQKVFSVTTSLATILMMSGVAALAPLATNAIVGSINEGATIRVANTFDVFIAKYVGANQYKRLILNPDVFNSYKHLSWSAVKTVTQAEMDQFTNSNLVRALGDTKVYMLSPNGDVGSKQWLNMTADQFTACGYDWNSIYVINNVDRDNYTTGTDITGCGATPSPTTSIVPVAGAVAVSLASDTPAAATILSYGAAAATDGQALVPALKLNFTAPSTGAVTVTTLKLTRGGISADSDIDNAYLYDGNSIISKLADMQSISSKVITFSNSAGLFTVPAGTTKSILVRFDVNRLTTSGKSIVLSLNSAADVSSNASSVSGAFPMTGNSMLTANVTDNAITKFAVVAGNSSAVDPGTTGFTAATFKLTPGNQAQQLEYIKFQMIGSAAATDVTNITLYDGATQIGTVQQLAADKTVVFDLSSSPLAISSAVVKNFYLKVDVAGGSTRTFYLSVQKGADLIVKDTAYGVYVRPYSTSVGTFTSQSSDQVTIGSGSLTVSKATDSPTGNIAVSAVGLVLAKYSMKAVGEDIKVTTIGYYATAANNNIGTLKNSKLMVDGTQVGTTNTTLTASGASGVVSTTVNFTVPAGTTKYLTIVADTTGSLSTSTVQISLNSSAATNGQRMTSLGMIAVPSAVSAANALTLKTGTATVTKNSGFGDASAASPTGVVGRTNVKIGSFAITSGAGEDINVTKITMSDSNVALYGLSADFQNLKVMYGSTQIGATIGTLQSTVDYSYDFSPVTAVTITNGQTKTFDVYADIVTGATHTATAFAALRVKSVSATGVSTSADAGYSVVVALQNVYIAAAGSLLIENVAASDKVQANMVYASGVTTNEVELYKIKLTAYTESVDVTRVIISDTITSLAVGATTSNGKPTSSLALFKLYDGSTLIGSNNLTSSSTPTDGGFIDFNIGTASPLNIAAGVSKTLTLKASVNDWSQISSGSTHVFSVRTNDPIQDTAGTYAITARGHDSSVDKSGPATALTASNATTPRKSYPVVKGVYPASGETWLKLASGASSGQTIAKFTVSAVGNEVRLKKITFNIALTDSATSTYLTLSSFKLYRNGTLLGSTEYDIFDGLGTATTNELTNSGTATLSTATINTGAATANAPSSTSTRAVLIFAKQADLEPGNKLGGGEEIIASGSTNTYEIKCDIAGANHGTTDSDSIVTSLLGDDTLTQPITGKLLYATTTLVKAYRNPIMQIGTSTSVMVTEPTYNFIWSDVSSNVGDHTNTATSSMNIVTPASSDWISGYQVRKTDTGANFLPLDAWTLSK